MAAVLVAAGYGVASLLGSLDAPYLPGASSAGSSPVPTALHGGQSTASDGPASSDRAGARLVPDGATSGAGQARVEPPEWSDVESITPLVLPTSAEPWPPATTAIRDRSVVAAAVEPSPLMEISAIGRAASAERPPPLSARAETSVSDDPRPHAKLLDVRAMPTEEDAWRGAAESVTIRSAPVQPRIDVAVARFDAPEPAPTQVAASAYAAAKPQSAMQASVDVPAAAAHVGELRTHIVMDGDSLPKLAGRYLDDPERSGEIFELNRELLEHPELLPIGVELKIPSRALPRPADVAEVPREASLVSRDSALDGMVPVRPIPPAASFKPRAQLLQPLPSGWQRDAGR